MYLAEATLDDLLMRLLTKLLKSKNYVKGTRGETTEISGVLLRLTNPRARLSYSENRGKLFSAVGELLWYLRKKNDLGFIKYYLKKYEQESEDGKTVHGGYGPRLFAMRGHDQIANIVRLLKDNPDTRRAVIQLFNAEDIATRFVEIPCTCNFHFMIRHNKLEMITHMRSNDAFRGLPHDVFAFTMIQEIVARSLGLEIGQYKHFVGSLHLYKRDFEAAARYIAEGWQPTQDVAMPQMPRTNPWPAIKTLLTYESTIRRGHQAADFRSIKLDPYWADMVRLLQIYQYSMANQKRKIAGLKKQMHTSVYDQYISKRQTSNIALSKEPQLSFSFKDEPNALRIEP
jgi:thymidylate synthase